jgi:hypothetical protein
MVYRLLNVLLSPGNYNKELNIIEYIACSNGYDSGLIDKLIIKQKSNKNSNNTDNKSNKKYVCVEFNNTIIIPQTQETVKEE